MSENVHRIVGNLLVGTGQLFVDTTTNQVGINTSSPSAGASLDIATGDLKVGSDITIGNNGTITAANFSGNGSGLSDINSDSGSWVKDDANSKIYVANSAHKVAIGTTSASELLTVGNDGVNADVVNNIRLNGRKASADGEICGLYFANSKDTGQDRPRLYGRLESGGVILLRNLIFTRMTARRLVRGHHA
jgi:hypothetical protein